MINPNSPKTSQNNTYSIVSPLSSTKKVISKNCIQRLPSLQPILHFDINEHPPEAEKVASEGNPNSDVKHVNNGQTNGTSQDSNFHELSGDSDQIILKEERTQMNNMNEPKDPENINLSSIDSAYSREYVFKRPRANSTLNPSFNPRKSKAVLVKKQAPSFLIIESLVWVICCGYEKDIEKRRKMYIDLCKSLAKFDVLGSSYLEESLQPLRDKISLKFNEEIYRFRNGIITGDKNLFHNCNPGHLPSPILDLKFLSEEHISKNVWEFNRYSDEFEEIEEISRGGMAFFFVKAFY